MLMAALGASHDHYGLAGRPTMIKIEHELSRNDMRLFDLNLLAHSSMGNWYQERALLRGSEVRIIDLAFQGTSEEQRAKWLQTPLERAAFVGDLDLVKMLLKAGAKGDAGVNSAVRGHHMEILLYLLEVARASPNDKDDRGYAPLHYAVANRDERMVKALLLHGAAREVQDTKRHHTPLHIFALMSAEMTISSLPVVQALLSADADVNRRYKGVGGSTALEVAAHTGKVDLMRLLLRHGAEANAVTAVTGLTPLHEAAAGNQAGAIDVLVTEARADLEAPDSNGMTPLLAAADRGNAEAVTALLRHGADRHKVDNDGQSALHLAATADDADSVVKTLLAAGVDVNLRDGTRDKRSALDWAIYMGNKDTLKAILRHGGVDVNSPSPAGHGRTALHHAVEEDDAAAIEALVQIGRADVQAKDGDGLAPLHWASKSGRRKAAVALVRAGADMNLRCGDEETSALDLAVRHRRLALLEALLDHGAAVNSATSEGETVLHEAARAGYREEIDVLVKAGADVNARDIWGFTPLHIAAEEVDLETVVALLAHGANLHAQCNKGSLPLHMAIFVKPDSVVFDVIECLLKRGSDETTANANGQNAVDMVMQLSTDPGEVSSDDYSDDEEGHRVCWVTELRLLFGKVSTERTWRRRAPWLLCRAYPGRARLEPIRSSRVAANDAKICCGVDRDGDDTGKARDEMRAARNFSTLAGMLLGLEEDGVFRKILGYL